jgi:cell division protein FtsL
MRMKLFRISTLVALSFAVASGTGLFIVSQRVQRAERHLADLKQDQASDEHSVRVLRAEWDYLNRPERLEALARHYLGMEPPVLSSITKNPDDLLPKTADDKRAAEDSAPIKPRPAVYRAQRPQGQGHQQDQAGFDNLIRHLSDEGGGGQ